MKASWKSASTRVRVPCVFSRTKHTVRMATSDLMFLSNALRENITFLRLTEEDPVEDLVCQKIGKWDPELIKRTRAHDQLHNFTIKKRFLFTEQEAIICRTSHCPVPPRLCATAARTPGLINTFQRQKEEPRRFLELLFRDLPTLEAKTFREMQEEFERLKVQFKNANPQDYKMVHRLQEGIKCIAELINVEATAADVLGFMQNSLIMRDRHRQYLEQVEKGLSLITSAKKDYDRDFSKWKKELEFAYQFSLDLKLPEKLLERARKCGAQLQFDTLNQKLKKQRGEFDPKKMPEGCSYAPTMVFTLQQLKKKSVVVEVKGPYQALEKNMKVTFRTLPSGGVEVSVSIAQGSNLNTVKQMIITPQLVEVMKRAEKNETVNLPPDADPFIVCTSSKLVDVLTKLSTGSK